MTINTSRSQREESRVLIRPKAELSFYIWPSFSLGHQQFPRRATPDLRNLNQVEEKGSKERKKEKIRTSLGTPAVTGWDLDVWIHIPHQSSHSQLSGAMIVYPLPTSAALLHSSPGPLVQATHLTGSTMTLSSR